MLLQLSEPTLETPDIPPAIGIDLGTTNSVVAVWEDGAARVLCDETGNRLHPSIVRYKKGDAPIIGQAALIGKEGTLVRSVKRILGRTAEDFTVGGFSYPLVMQQGQLCLKLPDRVISPIEVSADILRHLKNVAETALGQDVFQAVITVPAYFDDTARQMTKDAAKLAGLDVLRLINEPTAAALAYGLETQKQGTFVVYDLGGGTFDVSVLRLEKGVFQVLATGGDVLLGGDDIDAAIVQNFLLQVHYTEEISLEVKQRLLQEARRVKEVLSTQESADMTMALPLRDCSHRFMAADIEKIAQPFIERTFTIVRDALKQANFSQGQIDGVVLVGGSTRLKSVQKAVEDFFGVPPLIEMNPDEVVALGAATQAAALTKGAETLLLDVTPLSLGIETMGGLVEKIIFRNSPIPLVKTQEFTTSQEGQTALSIHIVQGEREETRHCRSLARFVLSNIPSLPAGAARIAVTFSVNVDGLLTVEATETTTGVMQKVSVKPTFGISTDDMTKMLYESLENGQQDMSERLLIEARVAGEQVLKALENAIMKDAHLLQQREKEEISQGQQALRAALKNSPREVIQQKTAALENICYPFIERRVNAAIGKVLAGKNIDDAVLSSALQRAPS